MPWTWELWWKQTKEVLGAAQKYRAFDILTLLLQLMQETGEAVWRPVMVMIMMMKDQSDQIVDVVMARC